MTTIDPADSVKDVLMGATQPMSTEQVVQALKDLHEEHEVLLALDFWRREHHIAFQDEDGNWTWQDPHAE